MGISIRLDVAATFTHAQSLQIRTREPILRDSRLRLAQSGHRPVGRRSSCNDRKRKFHASPAYHELHCRSTCVLHQSWILTGIQHDNNLPPIVSALGIWNTSDLPGVYPLPATHIPAGQRLFRSSHLVSFRGYVALERLSCSAPLPGAVKHDAGQLVVTPGKGNDTQNFVRVKAGICNICPGSVPADEVSSRLTTRWYPCQAVLPAQVSRAHLRRLRTSLTDRVQRPQETLYRSVDCKT